MRRLFLLVLATLLTVAYSTAQAQVGTELQTLTHDGQERSYYVYTPAADADKVMILLHPVASSGLAMAVETDFNTIADSEGYVVVYPNTLNSVWDDGRLVAELAPVSDPIDDVGFLATVADTVASEHGIDTSQIYLAGVGNGATMALTAACKTPDVYAGVAIVSALMWEYQAEDCGTDVSDTAVDMLFVYGSDDPVFWPQGRELTDADGQIYQTILGASDTADFWLNFNGCDPASYEQFSQTTLTVFPDCNNDAAFAWFSVLGGGATWLHPDSDVTGYLNIDTNAIIHAFFNDAENFAEHTIQEAADERPEPRSWLLYIPSTYDDSTPTPVVVNLHGRFANAFSQANSSEFNAVAEREGIIVVYPNALNSDMDPAQTEWNYGRGIPRYAAPEHDDEAFIASLIGELDKDLNIDRNRMYVTGLSNGGAMAQRMACTEHDTYAAFASVVAGGYYGLPDMCTDAGHAPILFYNGTDDTITPWAGARAPDPDGSGNEVYILAPMDATAAFWAAHNGCSETFEAQDLPSTDADSYVRLMAFNDCPMDSAVVFFAVIGGGHVWPGVRDFDSELLGEVNMDYNASDVIWDFFSQYTLEGRVDADGNLITDEPVTIYDVSPVDLEAIESTTDDTEVDNTETDETGEAADDSTNVAPEESPEAFVIERLREGGYIIYINHGTSNQTQRDTNLDSCATQRNLSEAGRTEAQVIGQAVDIMQIPVGQVISSSFCRTQETATLAFGETEVREDLLDLGILLSLLSETPSEGTNTIVVGHPELLMQYTNIQSGEGEAIVMLPLGNGNYRALTRLMPSDWVQLTEFYLQYLQQPEEE